MSSLFGGMGGVPGARRIAPYWGFLAGGILSTASTGIGLYLYYRSSGASKASIVGLWVILAIAVLFLGIGVYPPVRTLITKGR
jgi:hypothetical protein